MSIQNLEAVKELLKPYLGQYLTMQGVKYRPGHLFPCINPNHDDWDGDGGSCGIVPGNHNVFRCFGCLEAGDVFLAAHMLENKPLTGKSFVVENLKYLADTFGVEMPDFKLSDEDLYEIQVKSAYAHASGILTSSELSDSVEARLSEYEWSKETRLKLGIGSVTSFTDYMDRMVKVYGYDVKFLNDIDLANSKIFDPGNLIFTVCTDSGSPIGFAARKLSFETDLELWKARDVVIRTNASLSDEQRSTQLDENNLTKVSKYTNTSSKNRFYQKIRRLYGFHAAKKHAPPLYIMEGYPDGTTAVDRGLKNTCAIGATAFTKEHVDVILECGIKHIIIVLDGDKAGYDATDRAVKVIEESVGDRIGLKVELIQMPEGSDDPDKFLRLYGIEEFEKLPRLDIFSWKVKREMQAGADPIQLANEAVPLIVNEPNFLLRLSQIRKLAQVTGVDEEFLRNEVARRVDADQSKIDEERALIVARMQSDIKRKPDAVVETMRQAMAQIDVIEKCKSGYDPQNVQSAYTWVFEKQDAHVTDIELVTGWPIFDKKMGGMPKGASFISSPGKPNQGKFQPLTSKIKTRTGWKLMGELKVGDDLASIDDQPSVVTGIYPHGVQQVYRLTFSDGRSTLAGADHLWKVNFIHEYKEGSGSRIHNGDHVFTTDAIRTFCLNGSRKNSHRVVYVPTVSGDFGSSEVLPISPWLLGAMIGDGCMVGNALSFTSADQEIVDRMNLELYPFDAYLAPRGDRGMDFQVNGNGSGNVHLFKKALVDLGIYGNKANTKSIPEIYLNSSRINRIQLLRGLMDTDGTSGTDRTMQYCTVSEELAKNVASLVRSLGGICKTRIKKTSYTHKGEKKSGQDAYILGIRMADRSDAFSLQRKIDRVPTAEKRIPRLTIVSIEPEGEVECQCISVSHPSHLYVTDDYIVTHNSSSCSNLAWRIPENNDDVVTIYHTVDDSLDKAIPRILGSKYRLPSKLFKKAGYYFKNPDGRNEVAQKWPSFPQIYHESQAWLQHMIGEERLIIADINLLAGSLPALEGWLKTIRKRFANTPIFCMGDNFALYSLEVASDNESVRAREKSKFVKRIANEYQTSIFMTCELTKESLKPGIRPRMGNIKDTQGVAYDADANQGWYNDMKDRGDAADLVWHDPNEMVMTDRDGFISMQPRRKPILEMVIDKNKITDYDGCIWFEFDMVSAELRECSETEQASCRARAEVVTTKMLNAHMGGAPQKPF